MGNRFNVKYMVGDKTLRQACKEKGVNYLTCLWRIYDKCMTPKEALNFVYKPITCAKRRRELERRRIGVDKRLLEVSKQIMNRINHDKTTKYWYNGKRLTEWCKKHKVNYYTILYRMKNKNLTIKEAIETPWIKKPNYKFTGGINEKTK